MNFEFSEEQEMMRDAAKRLLGDMSSLEQVHKNMNDDGSDYDTALWEAMGENGWQGTAIPEEFGGAGLSYYELAVLAEEMGTSLACVPFSSSIYLCAEAILRAGTQAQKEKYLPGLASGETIGTLAFTEQSGRLDIGGIEASVSGGKLSGTKMPVADAAVADICVVAAKSGGGVSLYIVDLKKADVSPLKGMDLTRPMASVSFNGTDAELLGEDGKGWDVLQSVLDAAAVMFAFEQVGGASKAIQVGKEYICERYAFGRPLGSFQALKHRLADCFLKAEMARSNAYFSIWALASGSDELPAAACYARVAATDAYEFCSQECIQVHGGIGFTWQAHPHLFLKRAKNLESRLGGRTHWREQMIQRLGA